MCLTLDYQRKHEKKCLSLGWNELDGDYQTWHIYIYIYFLMYTWWYINIVYIYIHTYTHLYPYIFFLLGPVILTHQALLAVSNTLLASSLPLLGGLPLPLLVSKIFEPRQWWNEAHYLLDSNNGISHPWLGMVNIYIYIHTYTYIWWFWGWFMALFDELTGAVHAGNGWEWGNGTSTVMFLSWIIPSFPAWNAAVRLMSTP